MKLRYSHYTTAFLGFIIGITLAGHLLSAALLGIGFLFYTTYDTIKIYYAKYQVSKLTALEKGKECVPLPLVGEDTENSKYLPRLNRIIGNLTKKFRFNIHPIFRFKILSGDEASAGTNSYLMREPKIQITTGLLKESAFTDEEIESVVAHEYGHIANKDLIKRPIYSLLIGIGIGLLSYLTPLLVSFSILWFLGKPLLMSLNQRMELNADKYADTLTENPLARATFHQKITNPSKYKYLPGFKLFRRSFYSNLLSSIREFSSTHPSAESRIDNAIEMARKQVSPSAETSSYLRMLSILDDIDNKHYSELRYWFAGDNHNVKLDYFKNVTTAIDNAPLSRSLKSLLFREASKSKTANAGSGLTYTHTFSFLTWFRSRPEGAKHITGEQHEVTAALAA